MHEPVVTLSNPRCIGCHGPMYRYGFASTGAARWRCRPCNITYCGTRTTRSVARGGWRIGDRREQIARCLRNGLSIRKTQQIVKAHSETILRVKRSLGIIPAVYCGCGRVNNHAGWCAFKVAESPARQLYYQLCAERSALTLARVIERKAAEPLLVWPYLRDLSNPEFRLLRLVNDSVSRTLPEHVRADVCQEILMAVISGEISDRDVPVYVPTFTKRIWSQQSNRFRERSLDSLVTTSGRRLVEVIAG